MKMNPDTFDSVGLCKIQVWPDLMAEEIFGFGRLSG